MSPDETVPSPTPRPISRADATARAWNPLSLSLGASLLLLAAIVLGNVALARTSVRADLTDDRLFTLSDASKKVVGALVDPAKISVYWGDKLPPRAETVRRRLEGLLDEYAAASHGRLDVVWVKMDDAGREEASKLGIYETEIQELEGPNKVTAAKDYDGLAVTYGSRTEKLGPLIEFSEDQTLQLNSSVEYELSTAIYKVSRSKKAVVGLVRDAPPSAFMAAQGAGGDDRFSILGDSVLGKVYGDDFRDSVNLDAPVAADVSVLVVPAPKEWPAKKAFHLEQFLLRGGKVVLLLDPVDVGAAWRRRPTAKSGLEDWLDHVGVKVTPGVVGDLDEGHMGAAMTQDGSLTAYPYFINVKPDGLNQDNAATRGFPSVPFYFAAALEVDAQRQAAANRTATVLATTSAEGFVRADTSGLASASRSRVDAANRGRKTLLVELSGPFTSFWKGKPSPDEKPAEASAAPGAPSIPGMPDLPDLPGSTPPAPLPFTPPTEPTAPGPGATPEPGTPAPGTTPAPGMTGDATPPTPAPTPEPGMDADGGMAAPGPVPEPTPVPEGPRGPESAAGAPGAPGASVAPRLDEGNGVLLICGDAELVSDDFSGTRKDVTRGVTRVWGGTNGFAFVNNLVDWLSGSDDLLSLRARGSATRRLDEIEPDTATTAQAVNFIVVPLLVVLVGALVFVVRRYRS